MQALPYCEVLGRLEGAGRCHLLLSIAWGSLFSYGSLFDYVSRRGLSDRVYSAFERLGTNPFEGVLRLLEDGLWICNRYADPQSGRELGSQIAQDRDAARKALVSALTATHFARPYELTDSQKSHCGKSLETFHNVFILNYDLLLYWMPIDDEKPLRGDCFGESGRHPEAEHVVFCERIGGHRGILFLHGAMRIHTESGEVRKQAHMEQDADTLDRYYPALDRKLSVSALRCRWQYRKETATD